MNKRNAWHEFDEAEYGKVWDEFEQKFNFRPSVNPADWPGIQEPEPSITFHIGHVYSDDEARCLRLTNDLGQKLIAAFRKCVEKGENIFVLDWQHPSYNLSIHDEIKSENAMTWPVPPLPNGDYYIFLARDMSFGVFGHPWEQTMCIFGRNLIDAFEANLPLLFDRKIRINGKLV